MVRLAPKSIFISKTGKLPLQLDENQNEKLRLVLAYLDEIEQLSVLEYPINIVDCSYENELDYLKSRHGVYGKIDTEKVNPYQLLAIVRSHEQVAHFILKDPKLSPQGPNSPEATACRNKALETLRLAKQWYEAIILRRLKNVPYLSQLKRRLNRIKKTLEAAADNQPVTAN